MSPSRKELSWTTEKSVFLISANSSDRDLLWELLSHAFVHAEAVPQALVPAVLRSETFLRFSIPLIQHTTSSAVFLFLLVLTKLFSLSSKTQFLHTSLSIHSTIFLQTALPKFCALLLLKASVIGTQFFFSFSTRERFLQPFLISPELNCAKLKWK